MLYLCKIVFKKTNWRRFSQLNDFKVEIKMKGDDIVLKASIKHYKGVLAVTMVWIGICVTFQVMQSAAKWYVYMNQKRSGDGKRMSLKDAHYGEEGRMHPYRLTADRSVGNLLEWAWVFLPTLWIHAIFIDTEQAAILGWSYVVLRAFYPIAFYKKMPYAVTGFNYVSIYLLLAPVMSAVAKEYM